ncbi:MAG: hypothetical protein A7316_10970 [Candidatus Altiarchaeales archaeon WOR_SM1_86-2]|nr:MAG: hypothetical protein A7316_10970 [Candidatus Altiarchaeales archaeon WOR_SM1_86-2]
MEEFASGKKHDKISIDESGRYIIYEKYIEFRVPMSATGQKVEKSFQEISEGVQLTNVVRDFNPITSPGELRFFSGILELQNIIEKVKENFDDIVDRQQFFFEFKGKLNDLWKISKGREKEAVVLMEDAVKDLRSERLTKKKLKALERAIKILRTKIDKEALVEIDKIFLDARIFTIPVIDKLSEMYEMYEDE